MDLFNQSCKPVFLVIIIIVIYKHKLAYCVYLSHTKIQIFVVIIMPNITQSTMVSGINENYAVV